MSASERHAEGIPDDVLAAGYAGAMLVLVLLFSGLALLVNSWMTQSTPSMLEHEPPAPEIHH